MAEKWNKHLREKFGENAELIGSEFHEHAAAALLESETRFRTLIETVPDGIISIDSKGTVEMYNQAAEHLFGYGKDEVLGHNINMLMPEPYHSQHDTYLSNYLSTGIKKIIGIGREVIGKRKNGTTFPMYLSIGEMQVGERRMFTGIMHDLTELKQAQDHILLLNQKLEQYVRDLERSNHELQQFAYAASHDLKEPLRMVSTYCQILEEDYGDELDDDAKEYIGFAVDGAHRMQSLIDGLLEYSRVGTHKNPIADTDCEKVLEQVLLNLHISIKESAAEITKDPFPTVQADEKQLNQVFQNLIGNALKYRHEESPRIHLSVQKTEQDWQFGVHDNGIGIDPKHVERIFIIFQRLHPKNEYPGTGIGLAICKKIIERHGGRIWVESNPPRGTIFYFTLPIQTAAVNSES